MEGYGLNTSIALVGDWDRSSSETEYQKTLPLGVAGLGSWENSCLMSPQMCLPMSGGKVLLTSASLSA